LISLVIRSAYLQAKSHGGVADHWIFSFSRPQFRQPQSQLQYLARDKKTARRPWSAPVGHRQPRLADISAPAIRIPLFNHLVGAAHKRWWQFDAKTA